MKSQSKSIKIVIIALMCFIMTGCSIEAKARFRKVSLEETVLNFRTSDNIWVNDMANEWHYDIEHFPIQLDEYHFEAIDNLEGYSLNLEFTTYHLRRYYHLQLWQKDNSYALVTICYTAAESIPLNYSKQSYYSCPTKFAEELLKLRKNLDK